VTSLITARQLNSCRNSPSYTFNRRLVWTQNRSGPFGAENISLPPEIETLVLGYPSYRLIYPGIPAPLCNLSKIRGVELNGMTNVNVGQARTSKEAAMTYPHAVTNEKHRTEDDQVTWERFRRVSFLFWHINVIRTCFF
jgi:hypothetical protein